MISGLGWIGSVLLAICGAPEAYSAIKKGKTGLGWPFLAMWYLGEIFVFVPVLLEIDAPYLLLNYGLNILFITVIIKLFNRLFSIIGYIDIYATIF